MKWSGRRRLWVLAVGAALALQPLPARAESAASDDVARAAEGIRGARSYGEARPGIEALARGGRPGFAALERLARDEGLHAEVLFYVRDAAMRLPTPGALRLAAGFLRSPDQDLRRRAARTLAARGDATVAAGLLEAIAAETQPDIRALELVALARSGSSRALPVLVQHLGPGQPPEVLAAAARGLAMLGAGSYAPQVLSVVQEDAGDAWLRDLLESVRLMLGSPGLDQSVAWARDPGSPLRLFGLHDIRSRKPTLLAPDAAALSARLREAARSALEDRSPVVRRQAILALAAVSETAFSYISDPEVVAQTLGKLSDPSPRVRLAVLEALWNTVQRRGLVAADGTAPVLAPETMRMLRWPQDWRIFPRYVALLADPDPAVRERAAWMLGISTGYWHGYADIRLAGHARIDDEVRSSYQAFWKDLAPKTAAAATVQALDGAVAALEAGTRPEADAAWWRGVRLLTGRDFGWKEEGPAEAMAEAVNRLRAWWRANRDKHPAEWIVDALREGGFAQVSDLNLNLLGRWSARPIPPEAIDPESRQRDSAEAARRILEWWDAARNDARKSSP